jgi:hypothetical protein
MENKTMKPATSDLLVIEPPKKEFMIKPQILWGYGDMLGYDLVHTYKKIIDIAAI